MTNLHQNARVNGLDGLRAVSVGLVVLGHFLSGQNAHMREHGHRYFDSTLGVRIFFVISGFIITYLLLREESERKRISLPAFYTRRFFKLLPPLYVYVGAAWLVQKFDPIPVNGNDYWKAITFTTGAFSGWSSHWYVDHTWSLSVEEFFYLLWPPAFALFSRRNRLITLLAIIAASPIVHALSYLHFDSPSYQWMENQFVRNAELLAIGAATGFLLYETAASIRPFFIRHRTALRLTAIAMIVLPKLLQDNLLLGFFTVPFLQSSQGLGVAALILSYALDPAGLSHRLLNWRWVSGLGAMSYSVYLWQQIFLVRYGAGPMWFQNQLHSLAFILMVSYLCNRWLELPFQRLGRRLSATLLKKAETRSKIAAHSK